MSIFSAILNKIFPKSHAQVQESTESLPPGFRIPLAYPGSAEANRGPASVDVEAVVSEMAKAKGEKLNWKTSIVDLMKVLDLDSSLTARKQLAQELQYTGDTSDTASMNIWLQKQVMQKLAENGGKIPDELKH